MKKVLNSKKLSYITRSCMILLTTVLIILFFCIMLLVGQIQGTARVVNYAGLVRGATQREMKLEVSGRQNDELIQYLDVLVDGRFVEELKDNALPWKGSENQRVIDVQMTRKLGKVVLYA